jgi:hypothetical protein
MGIVADAVEITAETTAAEETSRGLSNR